MTVDRALGVSIPSYHAGYFAGEQNSLHALVVKRESNEKGFPYLLGTQLLGRAVGVENFHIVCERGPEILKVVIEDVFKRVTVVLIQCHPGIFFIVVAPGSNPTFHLTMPHLNVAVSSLMKTFPAISTASSWSSASSFVGFLREAPSPTLLYPWQTL
jgi:hypothetical protein